MVWLAMKAPEASAAMVVVSNWRRSPWLVIRNPPLSMISAVVASLFSSKSRNASSRRSMSSSISCGSVAMSCVLRRALADELVQQHAGDHVEGLEDALALVSDGREGRYLHLTVVEQEFHVLNRGHVGEVPLVVLQDIGDV